MNLIKTDQFFQLTNTPGSVWAQVAYLEMPVELRPVQLERGQPSPPLGMVPIRVVSKGVLDRLFFAGTAPVSTAQIADVIESIAGNEIQRFPARLPGSTESYEILNLTRLCNCFVNYPDLVRESQLYSDYPRVGIESSATKNSRIFRIDGYAAMVVVDRAIRDALLPLGVKGVRFQPLISR